MSPSVQRSQAECGIWVSATHRADRARLAFQGQGDPRTSADEWGGVGVVGREAVRLSVRAYEVVISSYFSHALVQGCSRPVGYQFVI